VTSKADRKWSDCTGSPCTCPPPSVPRLGAPPVSRMPSGWRCPDCRHVYAPWVRECSRCPRTLGQRIRGDQPVQFTRELRDGDIR
jgi:hypothetical protein